MENQVTPLTLDELRKNLSVADSSSQIIEERIITLNTNPAKHTLAWSNEDISRAFRELFMHSYAKLGNKLSQGDFDQKASNYRNEVAKNMANVLTGIQHLTTKWENELVELEHPINDNYSNPIVVKLNPSTPEEHDFIRIIEALDYFVIVQDNLWMAKGETLEQKQKVQQSVNKRISALVSNARVKSKTLRNLRLANKSAAPVEEPSNALATENV